VPHILGLHHVTLPATDAIRSSDWFELVFGFSSVLIKEEEDRVTMVTMEHPTGAVVHIHEAPEIVAAWRMSTTGTTVLGLSVADESALVMWEARLTQLGIEHSRPHQAHLGHALEVIGPDGLGIQLHTREDVSGDGP